MRAAERVAVERGRTLLALDTAADGGGASGPYEGLQYTLAGVIPGYAYKPHEGLTATPIYWKRPGEKAEVVAGRDGSPRTLRAYFMKFGRSDTPMRVSRIAPFETTVRRSARG
jgi:hypothetical protein